MSSVQVASNSTFSSTTLLFSYQTACVTIHTGHRKQIQSVQSQVLNADQSDIRPPELNMSEWMSEWLWLVLFVISVCGLFGLSNHLCCWLPLKTVRLKSCHFQGHDGGQCPVQRQAVPGWCFVETHHWNTLSASAFEWGRTKIKVAVFESLPNRFKPVTFEKSNQGPLFLKCFPFISKMSKLCCVQNISYFVLFWGHHSPKLLNVKWCWVLGHGNVH